MAVERKSAALPSLVAIVPALGVSLSWLCCLPVAMGFLGVGSAALGARLMPFRPYLIGVSVLFLGYAFYCAYRPAAGAAACDGDACECDAPAGRGRQRVIVWTSSTLALALLTFPEWSAWVLYWMAT